MDPSHGLPEYKFGAHVQRRHLGGATTATEPAWHCATSSEDESCCPAPHPSRNPESHEPTCSNSFRVHRPSDCLVVE